MSGFWRWFDSKLVDRPAPKPKPPKPPKPPTETRLLRIAGGVVAGVAVAHVINSGNDAANSWALAAWANQNGVQL